MYARELRGQGERLPLRFGDLSEYVHESRDSTIEQV